MIHDSAVDLHCDRDHECKVQHGSVVISDNQLYQYIKSVLMVGRPCLPRRLSKRG